ncbi:PREDICTED: phosphate transporter PHO1 homolog 10 [Fragaria vesca subsp. vesca]|uniref:phosphate transporter PHO1 homolog 10 n=1 Tax=Fragaria vesca subsp. vesca TaxID=101020 RepID=UPI0002C2F9EB|nr:PREDICTED: phosphate transporter PHO1 homolog 10 [Fragaria vesca subsp. vesca]XP_011463050.1 PREDICTED: phosphate transporter PHO1 homolog 10 [Fragaria vesca subsp. vesca]
MKFGKDFKKEMVPEWAEAYMDYNDLKRILRELREYKQSKLRLAVTPSRAFEQKPPLEGTLSEGGDVEDQVIDVNTLRGVGSKKFYKTKFLRQSEEGGEIEVTFFRKLDEELNKVNTFYKDKLEEVRREASQLNKQMDSLVALRIKVKNPHQDGSSSGRVDNVDSTMPLTKNTSAADTSGVEFRGLESRVKANDKDQQEPYPGASDADPAHAKITRSDSRELHTYDYNQDPLEVLEGVRINHTLESPLSTIKGVFKDSKEEKLSFDKEELRRAEERLRVAFIEFYHKLRLLKRYSFMNLSAFSKIMKKYEKFSSRRASRSYMQIVDNSALGNPDEVTNLMERVEATFINNFSHSNRRKGMKLLRPKAKIEKHKVSFLSGFFSGCSIALLVAIVLTIQARKLMNKKEGTQYMENIFPLYSLFGYIVLHLLMYAADIYFWRRCRINYPFIFGFKKGTELSYREVFLLSTGLAVIALSGFLANLHLEMDSIGKHYKTVNQMIPLGILILILVITFCPLDILYRSSRFFFTRTLFRCICAPLYPETFPDFFLADQLTSQMQALRSSVLYICYYGLGESSRRQSKCHKHGVYNTLYIVIAVIPFWMRFLQCIRRLCEERDLKHLCNGLKYFSTIVAVIVRTVYELHKGKTSWMVLALISSAVATMMNTYWDIVVDWGLLQKQSKNKFLRDRLQVSNKSIYFVAMVLDVILRLAWMQLVLEFRLPSLHKMTVTTIYASLEIMRRGMWSFFRLENEHLNNVGQYRAFKSVPLPFSYNDEDDDKDD